MSKALFFIVFFVCVSCKSVKTSSHKTQENTIKTTFVDSLHINRQITLKNDLFTSSQWDITTDNTVQDKHLTIEKELTEKGEKITFTGNGFSIKIKTQEQAHTQEHTNERTQKHQQSQHQQLQHQSQHQHTEKKPIKYKIIIAMLIGVVALWKVYKFIKY